ncbi:hypothetical protein HN387_02615 [Candidatus Woesearchaeota archaeon]|nr:hypothetical protein [Candidatus Woesearchaeota archaeon]
MPRRKTNTVEEIIEFVLEHEGPDLDGCAHPTKRRVMFAELDEAITHIHEMALLPNLRTYHFNSVMSIWKTDKESGKPLARELTGLLMDRMLQRHRTLLDVIKNIKQEDFKNEQFKFETKDGTIQYNLRAMLGTAYASSLNAAVMDWITHNPNAEIRTEYAGIKPWHFGRVPNGTWEGEKGKQNAREATGQLIAKLQQRHGTLLEVIQHITSDHFKNEQLEFTNKDGTLQYNLASMAHHVYQGSPSAAVIDWITHNPNAEIRTEYAGIKPWHFGMAPLGTWKGKQGKQNAREATELLMARMLQRHSTLLDVIKNISQEDFHKPLEFTNKDGTLQHNLRAMLRMAYLSSPSAAVIDWITHNPNAELKTEYAGIKPWHFGMAPLGTWKGKQGKQNARQLTGQLIAKLQQRHGTLIEVIKNISQEDFRKPLEFTNKDGTLRHNAQAMFEVAYNSSPSAAVIDWITHNPNAEIRTEYAGIKPWHFGMAPLGTWKGKQGKQNARQLTGQLIQKLHKIYGTLTDIITHVTAEDFHKERLAFQNRDGVITHTIESAFCEVYRSSPSAAILDWIKQQPERVRAQYSFVKPIHFVGTARTRARRLAGKLSPYDLRSVKKQNTYDTSVFGFKQYHSSDKDVMRWIMAEEAIKVLGDRDVRYLGLETEQFRGISAVYDQLNLNSFRSTVIERDPRVYNAMLAVKQRVRSKPGKAVRGTQIINGQLAEEVSKIRGRRYNYVNYDFQGFLSKGNVQAIETLFRKELLTKKAIIYVTLQETQLAKSRAKKAGFEDQVSALNQLMQDQSSTHTCKQMFTLDYQGGTTDRHKTPMIVVGYEVTRLAA